MEDVTKNNNNKNSNEETSCTSTLTCSDPNENKLILLAAVEFHHIIGNGPKKKKKKNLITNATSNDLNQIARMNNGTIHKIRIYQRDLNSIQSIERRLGGKSDHELHPSSTAEGIRAGSGNCNTAYTHTYATCTIRHLHQAIMNQCFETAYDGNNYAYNPGHTNTRDNTYTRIEVYNSRTCAFETVLDESNDILHDCNIINCYGNRIRCIVTITKFAAIHDNGDDANVPLQIMGRYFHYDSNGMDFAGRTIVVKEMINNQVDGTGLNVWDGALLL